jgi:hypothetical protein
MVQILPSDDAFADGTPVYGDLLKSYLRCNIDETGRVVLASPELWFNPDIPDGLLHDYYSQRVSAGPILNVTAPPWAAGFHGTASNAYEHGGFVARVPQTTDDVKVSMGWRVEVHDHTLGDLDDVTDWFYCIGVMARVAGGTMTDAGTADERIVDGDGYTFAVMRDWRVGNDACRLVLLRTKAGVTTLLDDAGFPVPSSASSFATEDMNPQTQFIFRMEVTGTGATVNIKCYLRRQWTGYLPQSGITSAELEVFDYDDTHADRLVASGRCGFITSHPRSVVVASVTAKLVQLIDFFQIEQDGSVVLRDEWNRRARTHAVEVTDSLSNTGRCLMSAMDGDDYGDTFTDLAKRSQDATYTNRLEFDADNGASPIGYSSGTRPGGFFFAQRPADQDNQRRSMTVVFDDTGTAPSETRYVGIALRCGGALNPGDSPYGGYILDMEPETSPGALDGALRIKLCRPNSVETEIARLTGQDYDVATAYKLEFEVQTYDNGGDQWSNSVLLKAWIDDVQISFDATFVISGVDHLSDGTVMHHSANKVLHGLGEGIRVHLLSGQQVIWVDDWTQETLSAPYEPNEWDEPSVTWEAEAVDHSGETFPTPVGWGLDVSPSRFAQADELGGGHVLRVATQSKERRHVRLNGKALTDAERDALLSFVSDHGTEIPFYFYLDTYSHEEGERISVVMLSDDFQAQLTTVGASSYSAEFLEVFE